MNGRFVRYLGFKGISQAKMSELSCVPRSTVSRFCSGHPVTSDKLLRMLQACDDLSLEWLFFGSGDMIRKCDGVTMNVGAFAGADVASGNGTVVKNSKGVNIGVGDSEGLMKLLCEKYIVIAGKDKTIIEKDALIERLYRRIESSSGTCK